MAPHVPDRWRRRRELDYKDAVFISPHKLIGGPGTPGVLVARRELFRNRVPTVVGGGHGHVREPARSTLPRRPGASRGRRDAGHRRAPSVPGSCSSSRSRSARTPSASGRTRFIRRAIDAGSGSRASSILGDPELPRLSICRFTVRHDGRYLHHNLVVALLNDLFGIQSRGGCSCAGPYGHRLLGIDIETSHAFEREILRGCEGIKPGWVRVNFNYFISETVFRTSSPRRRARRARRLAARAAVPVRAGDRAVAPRGGGAEPPLSLARHPVGADGLTYPAHRHREPESRLAEYLAEAERILADPVTALGAPPTAEPTIVDEDFEDLRWFWLPEEIAVRSCGDPSSAGRAGARGRRWRCRRRP